MPLYIIPDLCLLRDADCELMRFQLHFWLAQLTHEKLLSGSSCLFLLLLLMRLENALIPCAKMHWSMAQYLLSARVLGQLPLRQQCL